MTRTSTGTTTRTTGRATGTTGRNGPATGATGRRRARSTLGGPRDDGRAGAPGPGWRDAVALVLVAAAVALHVAGLQGSPLGLGDRATAAVVLALGIGACTAARPFLADVYGFGEGARAPLAYVVTVSAIGVVALVSGVVAVVLAGGTAQTVLVVAVVAMWVLASARHVGLVRGTRPAGVR